MSHSVLDNPLQSKAIMIRVLYLDFIRAVAICMVIISHFNHHAKEFIVFDSAIFWNNSSGIDQDFLGHIGVSLFIILSGASLMLSTKEGFDAKTFYKKRFLSIYPLFWVAYATTYLTLLLIHKTLPVDAPPLTFLLTILGFDGFFLYVSPNFYLLGEWFLGLIIIMYIIFPILRHLFLKYPLFAVLLCLCVTLLVGDNYHLEMEIIRFPLLRLMEFLFGMSFIYFFNPSHRALNLLICGMSVLLYYLLFSFNVTYLYSLVLQGLCLFTCFACVAELFNMGLFAKAIRFISAYSYGAFLIHHVFLTQVLPILKNLHLNYFNSYLLFVLMLVCIYALSFLLTNATAFSVRKISATRLFRSPA